MNLVSLSRPVALVRMYAGQWIVDCPLCSGAQVTSLGDRCVDCDTALEVRWPSDELRYGVERLLSWRPVPHTRNWSPGETLHNLLAENVEHRIGPDAGEEIMILGDSIVKDSLPAGRRLQIGA